MAKRSKPPLLASPARYHDESSSVVQIWRLALHFDSDSLKKWIGAEGRSTRVDSGIMEMRKRERATPYFRNGSARLGSAKKPSGFDGIPRGHGYVIGVTSVTFPNGKITSCASVLSVTQKNTSKFEHVCRAILLRSVSAVRNLFTSS